MPTDPKSLQSVSLDLSYRNNDQLMFSYMQKTWPHRFKQMDSDLHSALSELEARFITDKREVLGEPFESSMILIDTSLIDSHQEIIDHIIVLTTGAMIVARESDYQISFIYDPIIATEHGELYPMYSISEYLDDM